LSVVTDSLTPPSQPSQRILQKACYVELE
jgi:hypothetical protein